MTGGGPLSVKVVPADEIILVAGVNYPGYKWSNSSKQWVLHNFSEGPWRKLCTRWARNAVRTNKTLQVTLFDFHKGTRDSLEFDSGAYPQVTTEKKWDTLDPANYRRLDTTDESNKILVKPENTVSGTDYPHVQYYTGISEISGGPVKTNDYFSKFYGSGASTPKEASISIKDVYEYIQSVGKTRPSTVVELHLFSHAWHGGPIFANTWDLFQMHVDRTTRKRDPLDKDGRIDKDFTSSTINLADFSKAFASKATSYVWGCLAWIFMKHLVLETLKQMKQRKISDTSASKLEFQWRLDWGDDEQEFHNRLGGAEKSLKSDKKSVDDVVNVLSDAVSDTYMSQLAIVSENRVLGGLPGTYSDFDSKGGDSSRFMHVPMGKEFGDSQNFKGVLRFYKDRLKIKFDPKQGFSKEFGRGYAIYV